MKYLLDTHLLLWTSFEPKGLTLHASNLIASKDNELLFSVASIWEAAIKHVKHPDTFTASPEVLRTGLLDRGFRELPVTGFHALATLRLPLLHRDPFDRILLAQAQVEQVVLATVDAKLSAYDVPVHVVG